MNEITPPALKNREEHPDNESIDATVKQETCRDVADIF